MLNEKNEPKWTPGPYEVNGCKGPDGLLEMVRVSPVGDIQAIVHVMSNSYIEGDYLANANLFAAAPELYAACNPDRLHYLADYIGNQGYHQVHMELRDIADKIRAAQAKARGEIGGES